MNDKWTEAHNLTVELDAKRARRALDTWDEKIALDAEERAARMAEMRAIIAYHESAVALYDEQRAFWRAMTSETARQTEAYVRIAVALERLTEPTITVGGPAQPPPVCTGSGRSANGLDLGCGAGAICPICSADVACGTEMQMVTHAYRQKDTP